MHNMKAGFTATQEGMSVNQKAALRSILRKYRKCISEFHHGDCIGGDADAHEIAVEELGADRVFIHPPSDPKKRAFCKSPNIAEPKPYLVRNHDIVDMTDFLIAAPKTEREELRSGTWATVRYGRKLERFIKTLHP